MIDSFLSGLGWCSGALVAVILYILIRPLVRPAELRDAKDYRDDTLAALERRNELTVETNQLLSRIAESVEEMADGQ